MTGSTVDFDAVVVGGSPALLARASAMARAGLRVALFEEHADLGGSWRLFAPLGDGRRYDGFEHYIAGGRKYRDLLQRCGLDLVPRPIWLMFADGLTPSENALVAILDDDWALPRLVRLLGLNGTWLLPAASATADAAQGGRRLTNRQIQANLTSDGTPLGECRLRLEIFYDWN